MNDKCPDCGMWWPEHLDNCKVGGKPHSLKRAGYVIPNGDNRKAWCEVCRQLVTATHWQQCKQCDDCSWPPGGIERVDGPHNEKGQL